MKDFLKEDSGFTLAELLVVCSLMSVVLSAAWLAFTTVSSNVNTVSAQTELSNDSNNAMDILGREIRQAQEITNGGGVFASASGNDVSFYSNIDRGADGPERIRYYRQANTLYKIIGEPAIPTPPYNWVNGQPTMVMESLVGTTSPAFRFYDNASPPQQIVNPTSANLNTISMVSVALTAHQQVMEQRWVTHTTSTSMKIRCMFDSLN